MHLRKLRACGVQIACQSRLPCLSLALGEFRGLGSGRRLPKLAAQVLGSVHSLQQLEAQQAHQWVRGHLHGTLGQRSGYLVERGARSWVARDHGA